MIASLEKLEGLDGKRLVKAVLHEIVALRKTGRSWNFIAEKLARYGHQIAVSTLKSSVSKLKGKIDEAGEAKIAELVSAISANDAGEPQNVVNPVNKTSPDWWVHQPKSKSALPDKQDLTERQQAAAEKFMQRSKRLEEDQIQQQ